MAEVKVEIVETTAELAITETPTVIVLGNSGPQGAQGVGANTINGAAPIAYSTATGTISIDQSGFDHIGNLDYAQFDTTTTATGGVGKLLWNDTDGTLEFQLKGGLVTLQIGQEEVVRLKAHEAIGNGKAVYIYGASGANPLGALASNSGELTSTATIGVSTQALAQNEFGYITTHGLVRDIDTSLLEEGKPIWLSTAGNLTTTKPVSPAHLVAMGVCLRSNANNGVIYVNVINGQELGELHDVLLTDEQNNQALVYESATGLWKNKQISYAWLSNIPSTFTPSAHASTHGSAGSDPITIAASQVSGTAILVGEKGQPNGVATLDGSGLIPTTQLPPLAIKDTFVVASEVAMLALTAERGDVAIRTDVNKTFILAAEPASTLANWKEVLTPADGVTSVVASAPLTGGTITSTGTIGLDQTALTIAKTQVTGTAVVVSDLATATVGTAGYATTSGTAVYSTNSGTAVYATTSGTAVFATTAGSAANALTLGDGLSGTSYNGSAAITAAVDSTIPRLTASQTFTGSQTLIPGSAIPALITRAHSTGSANIQEWQSSAPGLLARVSSSGFLISNIGIASLGGGVVQGNASSLFQVSNAGRTPILIQGFSAQTADLLQTQNSAATNLVAVTAGGSLIVNPGTSGGTTSSLLGNVSGANTGVANFAVISSAATSVPAVIRGASGQTSNLLELQASNGNIVFNVTSSGGMVVGNTSVFLSGANVRFNGISNAGLGGGVGILGIGNATTVPTSNPTGGGVLYAEGGALKWRGSSGTITTIANA